MPLDGAVAVAFVSILCLKHNMVGVNKKKTKVTLNTHKRELVHRVREARANKFKKDEEQHG